MSSVPPSVGSAVCHNDSNKCSSNVQFLGVFKEKGKKRKVGGNWVVREAEKICTQSLLMIS